VVDFGVFEEGFLVARVRVNLEKVDVGEGEPGLVEVEKIPGDDFGFIFVIRF
jgi:hypothetical protein